MKGILTTVAVVVVIGGAAWLWKTHHTVTERREITQEEFDHLCSMLDEEK